jgi:hypothetical protein
LPLGANCGNRFSGGELEERKGLKDAHGGIPGLQIRRALCKSKRISLDEPRQRRAWSRIWYTYVLGRVLGPNEWQVCISEVFHLRFLPPLGAKLVSIWSIDVFPAMHSADAVADWFTFSYENRRFAFRPTALGSVVILMAARAFTGTDG